MRKIITNLWVTLAIAALMTAPLGCKPKQAVAPPTVPAQAVAAIENGLGPAGLAKLGQGVAMPAGAAVHFSVSSSTAGHEFKAECDGEGDFLQTAAGFLWQRLSIEKERLLIDGQEAAKIPAAARIEIFLTNTTLSVTANGTNVLSTTIKK